MDIRVSRKEKMYQKDGAVEVLKDGIFELYPVFGNALDENIITDIEILNNDEEELLDRALFALVKQRGLDPLAPDEGIPWSEAIIGEIPSPIIITLIQQAVQSEGPGVRVTPSTTKAGTSFKIELTNTKIT